MATGNLVVCIWLLTSIGLLQTVSGFCRWPTSLRRRTEVERCIESRVFPCPLPKGRFPWTPEIFLKFTSDIQFSEDFDEADRYHAAFSAWRKVKVWSLIVKCLGYDAHYVTIMRHMIAMPPPCFPKQVPPPEDPLLKVTHEMFDGVEVILYQPTTPQDRPRGGLVYMYDGGWVVLSAGTGRVDTSMRSLAKASNVVIACIEYRRAPEHIYPAPLNDAIKATRYFMTHSSEFGVDENRIAVGGDTAGGNLAAAMTLKFRDMNWRPRIKLQVLIYPPLQSIDFMTPSYQENACDGIMEHALMRELWLWYGFGDVKDLPLIDFSRNCHTTAAAKARYGRLLPWSALPDTYDKSAQKRQSLACRRGNGALWNRVKTVFTDPYFAPLMARDLRRLPETLILNVKHSVLRDDGIIYGRRLRAARVKVTTAMYCAPHHIFVYPESEVAKRMVRDIGNFLNCRL